MAIVIDVGQVTENNIKLIPPALSALSDKHQAHVNPCSFFQEMNMAIDENTEQQANNVGEMRDQIREKLENMEAEGVKCVPIKDVRIILNAHYNLMYQLVYEGR